MLSYITTQPWYLWVILGVLLLYIFLIYFFCHRRGSESYEGNNPKTCVIFTIITIFLILASFLVILLTVSQ